MATRAPTSSSKITLRQVYVLTLITLVVALGAVMYLLFSGSQQAVVLISHAGQSQTASEVAARVTNFLGQAEEVVSSFERLVRQKVVRRGDRASLELALTTQLLSEEDLADITFTYVDGDVGRPPQKKRIERATRGQVTVWKVGGVKALVRMRRTTAGPGEKAAFTTCIRESSITGGLLDAVWGPEQHGNDPTTHLTFTTPISPEFYGQLLWSDLHWADADKESPDRRVVVTVQKAIQDDQGHFLGVLRVGLLTAHLDEVARMALAAPDAARNDGSHQGSGPARPPAVQRVFIADAKGRFITRWDPGDPYLLTGEDLRARPKAPPAEVVAALELPELAAVNREHPDRSTELVVGQRTYLASFHALPRGLDWIVGIVVPRDHYLGTLEAAQQRVLLAASAVLFFILLGGMGVLRVLRRDLGRVVTETARMGRFEFQPARSDASLAEMDTVLHNMEQAKTALRALGKYASVDLVRRLYEQQIEPVPGGELAEVTLMFTDVEGFTSLSEKLTPNELAVALGRYFEVMARAVHANLGVIDKYIGDAVMALWNVPSKVPAHPRLACAAALACIQETDKLFATEAWKGLPRLHTRFGLHSAQVMVGHFGAPDRLNYTALGDGVNLASRLEGINKAYGTTIIASQSVYEVAKDAYTFRLLDLVAVKGKAQAVRIYELVGEPAAAQAQGARLRSYEQAFEKYLARDFQGALALLAELKNDPPSVTLTDRCQAFLKSPPPADWNGVYVAKTK
jgi:adenylate cyclase